MKKKRLAIITSHPIQYNAPMFALLHESDFLESKVFYTWSQSQETIFDKDFGKEIKWDIPLLEGYDYTFVKNVSLNPGPIGFKGIDCPTLNDEIKAWGADALMVYGWNYKAHFNAMRHFHGKIPVYFRGDSTLIDEAGGIKQNMRRLVLKFVYHYCDSAFYVGINNKAYFLKHGFKENQLFFAPHAIDNKRFRPDDQDSIKRAFAFRAELGIPSEDIVLLFVGKFESKKNPVLLLEAFQQLNLKGSHLVFVGNGNLENELLEKSKGNKQVHFMPFQNQQQMPAVYHMADLVALPSQGPGETWGLVVNEAMACGKAVLVSDKAGCQPDLVINEFNGMAFKSNDLNECMDSLKLMLKNKHDLLQMGVNARAKIEEWSFENIVKSFEKNI
jgi:glycosyltransferase involved in cell wall biosynthesis